MRPSSFSRGQCPDSERNKDYGTVWKTVLEKRVRHLRLSRTRFRNRNRVNQTLVAPSEEPPKSAKNPPDHPGSRKDLPDGTRKVEQI